MKRLIPLTILGLLLAACQTHQVNARNDDQALENKLMHHRFILTEVNGKTINSKQTAPFLAFGEKMFVSASMCNDFNGFGNIKNAKITVKNLSRTELECVDEDLSKWDSMINRALSEGAIISLKNNKLVLTQGHYKLVYTLRDYVN
ncbi:META domain-containing protein [Providencia huaxiensis]|uniref:META domain-containing protein n=1 Tax=Providencia huaxiensis TaxID=2027290 RepID=A0ABU2IXT5_9GAMM|nr:MULTISPECIES: META domain-containing protein [Providencia]MBZ3680429.1 META domain-containing protein [Providencia rettgeri]AXH61637.1 META domain-containing protein [Providencia huaxiensis]MBN6362776.1 META domain-containing protein [Providencia huaxiensis]MCD2529947.1 META domain-containing protein [Providencia huaxiensis]MCG9536109.1 META domain-containing protein [Providencia huaxiensis]